LLHPPSFSFPLLPPFPLLSMLLFFLLIFTFTLSFQILHLESKPLKEIWPARFVSVAPSRDGEPTLIITWSSLPTNTTPSGCDAESRLLFKELGAATGEGEMLLIAEVVRRSWNASMAGPAWRSLTTDDGEPVHIIRPTVSKYDFTLPPFYVATKIAAKMAQKGQLPDRFATSYYTSPSICVAVVPPALLRPGSMHAYTIVNQAASVPDLYGSDVAPSSLASPWGTLVSPVFAVAAPMAEPANTCFCVGLFADVGIATEGRLSVEKLAYERNVDALLLAGDLAYAGLDLRSPWENDWDRFQAQFEGFTSAVPTNFGTVGNHDCEYAVLGLDNSSEPTRGRHFFGRYHPPGLALPNNRSYYSFDVESLHVVVLDSTLSKWSSDVDEKVDTLSRQLDWLKDDLAATVAGASSAATRPWILVMMHHPLHSLNSHHGGAPMWRRMLQPILDEFGVDFFFAGHVHNYERTRPLLSSTNPHLESLRARRKKIPDVDGASPVYEMRTMDGGRGDEYVYDSGNNSGLISMVVGSGGHGLDNYYRGTRHTPLYAAREGTSWGHGRLCFDGYARAAWTYERTFSGDVGDTFHRCRPAADGTRACAYPEVGPTIIPRAASTNWTLALGTATISDVSLPVGAGDDSKQAQFATLLPGNVPASMGLSKEFWVDAKTVKRMARFTLGAACDGRCIIVLNGQDEYVSPSRWDRAQCPNARHFSHPPCWRYWNLFEPSVTLLPGWNNVSVFVLREERLNQDGSVAEAPSTVFFDMELRGVHVHEEYGQPDNRACNRPVQPTTHQRYMEATRMVDREIVGLDSILAAAARPADVADRSETPLAYTLGVIATLSAIIVGAILVRLGTLAISRRRGGSGGIPTSTP